ncbi:MAG: RNA polymerase-associated protein RapA [Natronospirillum sp.]
MIFASGQRWFSQTEPELGLGIIESVANRRLNISFPAVDEVRTYAESQAPLQRYLLQKGDTLTTADGMRGTVQGGEVNQHRIIYLIQDEAGEEHVIPEMLLAHELKLDSADKRLLAGQVDHLNWYQLRQKARAQYSEYQSQTVRGLLGGRIQLTPHQYYLAQAATKGGIPRILLSDEVGLGKTIEAGLILHKLEIEGRVQRTLITVPDHLLHQWLVELLRKFNMPFSIFDHSRLDAALEENPDGNPFDDEQRVLVPVSLWQDGNALALATRCEWDLLIVDEAHHLAWSEEAPSLEYQAIETLSASTPGLLLLTATPEQLGVESHFARLRLLDPQHFHNLQQYLSTHAQLETLSTALGEWLDSELTSTSLDAFCTDAYSKKLLAQARDTAAEKDIQLLVDHLIDVQGTGRIQYRNTRDRIAGFPERQVHPTALPLPEDYQLDKPYPEIGVLAWTEDDPRVEWLVNLAQTTNEKLLVICHNLRTATGLEGHLRLREGLRTAQFHEDMTLIERDRAGAYFADQDDGAQILVCSEIGSEGRNFQFAHHLVCFDLPNHPDLLEQRIGRLDRIGQTNTIQIHVPYFIDHVSERWFEWYHAGLNAFEQTCGVGQAVLSERVSADRPQQLDYLDALTEAEFQNELTAVQTLASELTERLRAGKNRLLEWHSFNRHEAQELLEQIAEFESQLSPESFMIEALDSFGIDVEDEGQGIFSLQPSANMLTDSLPFMGDEGTRVTFRRSVAVSRDDIQFITWEHPMVDFVLETLEDSHLGAAGVTLISQPDLAKGSLYVAAHFMPIMQHPSARAAGRYLPQASFQVVVDQESRPITSYFADKDLRDLQQRIKKNVVLEVIKSQNTLIASLLEQVRVQAEPELSALKVQASEASQAFYDGEIARLEALQTVSGKDFSADLAALQTDRAALADAIGHAELHLDAVRLIVNF